MDIFTINLDSRPDRWNRVMAIQRAYPWARFQRIAAVPIPMYPIAACTASHQLAVLMACAEGLPSITVAEDDLEPTRFFNEWPTVVEKARDLGLDYVLGAVSTSEDNTPTEFMGFEQRGVTRHPAGENTLLVEARTGRGTHLITYFASAYQKILGFQFGVPIDSAIGNHPELRGGFALPFVAVQGDGYSDLCNKPYLTPALYMKAAARWAERVEIKPNEPWSELLRPAVPFSEGLEVVRRLTPIDVLAGRHFKLPAFDASKYLEARSNG